jgi:hypothetical protein
MVVIPLTRLYSIKPEGDARRLDDDWEKYNLGK